MAGKMRSIEPTIDPTAKLQEVQLGSYSEVGSRTVLLDVVVGDYSYVVNDAQITYTTIGKFCSIAAIDAHQSGQSPDAALRKPISLTAPARIFRARVTKLNSSRGDAAIECTSVTMSGSDTARLSCRP